MAQGLNSVRPDFKLEEWVIAAGIARLRLLQEIRGCGNTDGQVFSAEGGPVQILKDGWNLTESALCKSSPAMQYCDGRLTLASPPAGYNNFSSNGNTPFAGPVLVIQGIDDLNAHNSVSDNCHRP